MGDGFLLRRKDKFYQGNLKIYTFGSIMAANRRLYGIEKKPPRAPHPKLEDHYIAAVFAKLEVHSRAQAITAAYTLGLLPPLT